MTDRTPRRRTALERFAGKLALDDNGCWIWLGATIRGGYGCMFLDGKNIKPHRWAYEHFVGPIPEGFQIDHLCRVVACCNPAHLEPVTQRENILRSQSPSAIAHRTNTCAKGHSLVDAKPVSGGRRRCRPCSLAWQREYARKRRAAA